MDVLEGVGASKFQRLMNVGLIFGTLFFWLIEERIKKEVTTLSIPNG